MLYVFVDTNIFLHYRPLNELTSLYSDNKSNETTFVVSTIVLEELDTKKFEGQTRSIRDRAKKAQDKIMEWAKSKVIDDNVYFDTMESLSTDNVISYNLDPKNADSRLLADVMAFSESHPNERTILLSADASIRVRARAHNVDALCPEDTESLPPELDEQEKEHVKIRNELAAIKNAQPKLRTVFKIFPDNPTHQTAALIPPNEFPVEEYKKRVEQESAHFKRINPPPEFIMVSGFKIPNTSANLSLIPNDEYDRYNYEVATYPINLMKYYREKWDRKHATSRLFQLELLILNEGKVSATDVGVNLHFPENVAVYKSRPDFCDVRRPSEPIKPRALLDRIGTLKTQGYKNEPLNFFNEPSGLKITKTNGYEVHYEIPLIRQNESFQLPTFYVYFESYETADSFKFDSTMQPANGFRSFSNKLHFIVERPSAEST